MTRKNKSLLIVLLLLCVVLVVGPVFALRGAEFGGSDDAGSIKVAEITGEDYEPWFTPVFEQLLGGELPGELESLLFCVQTGIGVGVIAFFPWPVRGAEEAGDRARTGKRKIKGEQSGRNGPLCFSYLSSRMLCGKEGRLCGEIP